MDDAQNIDIFSGDYLSNETQDTNPFIATLETVNDNLTAWYGSGGGGSWPGGWYSFEDEPFLADSAPTNPDPFAPTLESVEAIAAGEGSPLFGEMAADTGFLTGF